MYFILIDRYENGNPSNDGSTQPLDPTGWHGGDLAGVEAHLDDLTDLGIGTVWLSPVTASRQAPLDSWGAFHGYWVQDHHTIEPRFGTEEEARRLADSMHTRGLRLLLDTVWNHVGYESPLTQTHPDWFHQQGNIEDWSDPLEAESHDVHGLPDLDQGNVEVRTYLETSTVAWIDRMGADGLRIDAVRHLPSPFLRAMSEQLRDQYGDTFALLGEHFEGDPYRLATRRQTDGLTSIFDFPMHYAMAKVFCQDASVGALAAVLSDDRAYEAPSATTPWLEKRVTFLDNHDTPRIASVCGGDLDRVARALAFQITTRGTPSLYMGTEHGMLGEQDPANRADMVFGPHPLRTSIQGLLAIRGQSEALREGRVRLEQLSHDLLLYSRVTEGEAALIAINQGNAPLAIERPQDFPGALKLQGQVIGAGPIIDPGPVVRTAPGRSVSVWVFQGNTHEGLSQMDEMHAATRTLTLHPKGAPVGPGDRIGWVGPGPLLGHWDPKRAVLSTAPQATAPLTLGLPEDSVLTGKLIVVHPDGSVTWQPGQNTHMLVRELPSDIAVSWPGG